MVICLGVTVRVRLPGAHCGSECGGIHRNMWLMRHLTGLRLRKTEVRGNVDGSMNRCGESLEKQEQKKGTETGHTLAHERRECHSVPYLHCLCVSRCGNVSEHPSAQALKVPNRVLGFFFLQFFSRLEAAAERRARQVVILGRRETHEQPTQQRNTSASQQSSTQAQPTTNNNHSHKQQHRHQHHHNNTHTPFFTTRSTHDIHTHKNTLMLLFCRGSSLLLFAFCSRFSCLFSGVSLVVCYLVAAASCSLLLCAFATRCSQLLLSSSVAHKCCFALVLLSASLALWCRSSLLPLSD